MPPDCGELESVARHRLSVLVLVYGFDDCLGDLGSPAVYGFDNCLGDLCGS